jgi:putative photosynthetic complex assembly protein
MRHHRDTDEIIPSWAAGLGGLLMIAVLAATTWSVATEGRPVPAPATSAPVAESRSLSFTYHPTGAVTVHDGETGALVADLTMNEGGFVSGVLRVMALERRQSAIGIEKPFRLTAYGDGRLSLADPETGRMIDINAFGRTQVETFAALL